MSFWQNVTNPLKIKKIFTKENFTPKKIGKYLLYALGGFLILSAILFAWFSKDLPTAGKIKALRPIESTKILDRNGNVLYDVSGDQRRTVIDFNQMPDSVKQATIAAEDKNFYKNFGISFTGILRSLYYDVTGKSGYLAGGSTITQQYVKNALLTPQKTLTRKIKELILTIEVSVMFSKDQILGMYLNEIPYGSNAYGIEEASKTYFGKSAKDLTLAESTTLAALPKAPTYYSPYGSHPDKLKARQEYILDRMVDLKYITSDQAKDAKAQKLTFVPYRQNITAPHFVMYVKDKLVEMFGEQMVEEGGLKVTTSLDPDKQKIAEEAIQWGYERNQRYGTPNDALVSIDPKTGQILAMVGSHDYFDSENDGQVNVTDSERQPGSSFKPIVYATAFKGKYDPAFTLWDVRTDFGNYSPQNYDGSTHGPVSMRTALANSLNIPAVKTLGLVGVDKALQTAHDLGITTLNDPKRYGLALVLGGGEVKPVDLTTAYGVFADKGVLHATTPILKVQDSGGKNLYEFNENKNKKEVLDPQIAYEISNILSDNNARNMVFGGLQANLSFGNRPVAVKTGTTQEYHDAWTVGYTPSIVTGVWVGNNDNTPMKNRADGSVAAAPIWHRYMDNVLKNTDTEQFERPAGIKDVTVDRFSNKLPTANSPETITDIFASWQVPTENDDIHVKVRISKICGDKLATDDTPADQVEERTYTNLHSEKPDNPSWEGPVRAWAEANGIHISSPPTETCTLDNQKPTINITEPQSGKTVSGVFSISADVKSNFAVKYVEFFIDNISIGSDSSSPYSISYNANSLSAGSHQISAVITDEKNLTAKSTITINSVQDTTAPGSVSNVSLNPQSGAVTISWKNPADADVSKVRIYVSTVSGSLGAKHANEIPVTANSTTTYTVSGLGSTIHYYFTLRPVDTSGNENQSTTQYSAVAL